MSIVLVALAFGVAKVVLLELMRLPDVPSMPFRPPASSPLTRKLVFIVADALRYDYATDPARAPNIARHMSQDAHAELWAGRITMTSASVLAMGTGQRGDFAEVITNLHAGRTRFDDFINSARRSGMKTGLVGDMVWPQMFDHFDVEVTDDAAMAIDVDNSEHMLSVARGIIEKEHPPDLLIAHFIATDHQGHAYGMASARYAEFLKRFDAGFQQMLDRIPADTTVMFMSDHGATDTGAHGSDIAVARRSPFFAYGPGIRKGVDLGSMDQLDIGPTTAALLGVPAPLHARGTIRTELLDLPATRAAQAACGDAQRAIALARASGLDDVVVTMTQQQAPCTVASTSPESQIQASRQAVRSLDQALDQQNNTRGVRGAWMLAAALSCLVAGLLFAARKSEGAPIAIRSRTFPWLALAICAASVVLTLHVERITPPWHNVTRGVLLFACNLAMLVGLLRPHLGVRWYNRWPTLAWVLLPGALAWSYTANTQVMSWVVLAVSALVLILGSDAESRVGWLARGVRLASWVDWIVIISAVALLLPFGTRQDEPLPAWMGRGAMLVGICLLAISAWLILVATKLKERPAFWQVLVAVLIAAGSLGLRRVAPSALGLGGILLLPVACVVAWRRGMPIIALGCGMGAWLWVSRDEEVPPMLAALALVETMGRLVASRKTAQGGGSRHDAFASSPWMAAIVVTFLFAVSFLARVGMQRGLDFTSMDFGAGSFGDPDASSIRIASSLVWKYVCGELLLIFVYLRLASPSDRRSILFGATSVFAIRAITITLMLFVCRTSYWTAFRTLSDAGPALALMVAAAIVLGVWGSVGKVDPAEA